MVAERVSYDRIGLGYATARRTDPRIAQAIWAALGDARTVLNVGAGTGSYEPPGREVTAIEPSAVMRAQRRAGSALCLAGHAEALPFPDRSFDAAMAVLSDHHWTDPLAGLAEMRRVARRVVVFQWDFARIPDFWLVRHYLPDYGREVAQVRPTLAERDQALAATVHPVPIPCDCVDGFFHAHWRRPEAYLKPEVRRTCSVWARLDAHTVERALAALRADLASGRWHARHHDLTRQKFAELGARLLVADTATGRA